MDNINFDLNKITRTIEFYKENNINLLLKFKIGLEKNIPLFKKGNKIKIKKKNRGKFTKSANRAGMGVQEFANHVLANKDKYSSTLIKRANFARNASKWNK